MAPNGLRMTGKIKFFDTRKGFGFIKPDDGGQDVFLSVTKLPKERDGVFPDARCSFEITTGKRGKGPAADKFEFL